MTMAEKVAIILQKRNPLLDVRGKLQGILDTMQGLEKSPIEKIDIDEDWNVEVAFKDKSHFCMVGEEWYTT